MLIGGNGTITGWRSKVMRVGWRYMKHVLSGWHMTPNVNALHKMKINTMEPPIVKCLIIRILQLIPCSLCYIDINFEN